MRRVWEFGRRRLLPAAVACAVLLAASASAALDPGAAGTQLGLDLLVGFLAAHPTARVGDAEAAVKVCYAGLGKRPRESDVRACVSLDYYMCKVVLQDCSDDVEADSYAQGYRKRSRMAIAAGGLKPSAQRVAVWQSSALAVYEKTAKVRTSFVTPEVRAAGIRQLGGDGLSLLTRFGIVDVVRDPGATEHSVSDSYVHIRFRGKRIREGDAPDSFEASWNYLTFTHYAKVGDADVLLGTLEAAATAWCLQVSNFMLVVKPNGEALLKTFGCTHSFVARLEVGVFTVEYNLPAQDVGEKNQLLVFDGTRINELVVHESEDGARIAGVGSQVLRWVGKSADDLFEDPGERLRFLSLMDRKTFQELRNRMFEMDAPFFRLGSVVCGRGWLKFWGRAVVGIEIKSGKPFSWYEDMTEDDTQSSFGIEGLTSVDDARACVEGEPRL